MDDFIWYCPAVGKKISEGLCWEYCFAEIGGPIDTANELKKWIEHTKRFLNIEDFHKICKECIHCQWSK